MKVPARKNKPPRLQTQLVTPKYQPCFETTTPVTVVVTSFNKQQTIALTLGSIIGQHRKVNKVVVADDGSTDATVAISEALLSAAKAGKLIDDYEIVQQEHLVYRINTLRNLGVSHALDGFVIMTDGDTIFGHNAVACHLSVFTREPKVLTYGPRFELQLSGEITMTKHMLKAKPHFTTPVGSHFGFSKKLWNDIGRFDTRYDGAYGCDETDFVRTALLAGSSIIGVQEATHLHLSHPANRTGWQNQQVMRDKFANVTAEAALALPAKTSKLRIAIIGPGCLPIPPNGWGGIERVVWNQHLQMKAAGVESIVINSRDPEVITAQCLEFKPNIIHVNADGLVPACMSYVKRHPTAVVVTSHHSQLSVEMPSVTARDAKGAFAVIALAESIQKRFTALGCQRVYTLQNGVDTELFKPLDKVPNTVMAVGRNEPRKRLVDIAKFFVDKPEYKLTICGPLVDAGGPVIPTAPNIVLLGNQDEQALAAALGRTEYFVHLCEIEACVLVVREAMSCGCKVWTVPFNKQGLANVALTWEAATSDSSLGLRAREEAVQRLDWRHITAKLIQYYTDILAAWELGIKEKLAKSVRRPLASMRSNHPSDVVRQRKRMSIFGVA